jgi:D-arabinitol 2-dehydrogenase
MMFKAQAYRQVARAAIRPHDIIPTPRYTIPNVRRSARLLSSTAKRASDSSKDDPYRSSSTAAEPTDKQAHEGSFSRTDNQVSFEYPDEESFPRSKIVQGRGGPHLKRTLPTFSLEGKVAVVTGGARGLGLTMGQALVASGADLAIVDLNSEPRVAFT